MARRFVGLAWLALLGAIAAPSSILADDPPSKLLDEAATRARLAKDALKVSVESALSKADKLPVDAAGIVLQSTINEVNEAAYLTPEERKGFLGQLTAKRKSIETAKPGKPTTAPLSPKDEQARNERISEELNIIKALDKKGEASQARARLRALMEKNPDHPALLAYATVTSRQDMAKDLSRTAKNKGNSEGAALNDIDTSASKVPPNGSIAYDPKVWEKATKRPAAGSVVNNLSGGVKKILAALDQSTKTGTNFNNTSFDQVIKQLEAELGFPLVISKQTMEEVRITYESTVTYELPKGVTKRNLIKGVLAELGLTYIIKGELVQVVSFVQAKSELSFGVMDVATLLRNGQSAESLMNLIKTQIEPDSWEGAGGNGTITFQPPGVFFIKNSAEVIYRLGAKPK